MSDVELSTTDSDLQRFSLEQVKQQIREFSIAKGKLDPDKNLDHHEAAEKIRKGLTRPKGLFKRNRKLNSVKIDVEKSTSPFKDEEKEKESEKPNPTSMFSLFEKREKKNLDADTLDTKPILKTAQPKIVKDPRPSYTFEEVDIKKEADRHIAFNLRNPDDFPIERIKSTTEGEVEDKRSRLKRNYTTGHMLEEFESNVIHEKEELEHRTRSASNDLETKTVSFHLSKHIGDELLKNRIRYKFKNKWEDSLDINRQRFFFRLIIFPLYYSWWKERTDEKKLKRFSVLYCTQLFCTFLYLLDGSERSNIDRTEIVAPYVLLLLLTSLFVYCVSMVPSLALMNVNNESKEKEKQKKELSTEDQIKMKANEKKFQKLKVESPRHSVSSQAESEGEGDDEGSQSSNSEKGNDSDVDTSDSSLFGKAPQINLRKPIPDEESEIKSIRFSGDNISKVKLTAAQIRSDIEEKISKASPSRLYRYFAMSIAAFSALLPTLARLKFAFDLEIAEQIMANPLKFAMDLKLPMFRLLSISEMLFFFTSISCFLSCYFVTKQFFMEMCLAEEAFFRRYSYARCFKKLTSEHKAKKMKVPHFRLTKPANIRVWLSLRNRRRKNQDTATRDATADFLVMLTFIGCFLVFFRLVSCLGQSNDSDYFFQSEECVAGLQDCYFLVFLVGSLAFSFRFSSLFNKTVSKYNCNALLYTEIVNLQMLLADKKKLPPWKVDEYRASMDIIKSLQPLLKVLEPEGKEKKNNRILLHPMIYSFLRLVILSGFGSFSSNIFGFKVKFWKL